MCLFVCLYANEVSLIQSTFGGGGVVVVVVYQANGRKLPPPPPLHIASGVELSFHYARRCSLNDRKMVAGDRRGGSGALAACRLPLATACCLWSASRSMKPIVCCTSGVAARARNSRIKLAASSSRRQVAVNAGKLLASSEDVFRTLPYLCHAAAILNYHTTKSNDR